MVVSMPFLQVARRYFTLQGSCPAAVQRSNRRYQKVQKVFDVACRLRPWLLAISRMLACIFALQNPQTGHWHEWFSQHLLYDIPFKSINHMHIFIHMQYILGRWYAKPCQAILTHLQCSFAKRCKTILDVPTLNACQTHIVILKTADMLPIW